MIEIVRYTQRNVKRWRDGDMRRRWTAAGMLVAEQQFRRIIGYRELAKLVIAIERHTLLVPTRTATNRRLRARYRLTVNPWGSPPKFHDDPDILRRCVEIGFPLLLALVGGVGDKSHTRVGREASRSESHQPIPRNVARNNPAGR